MNSHVRSDLIAKLSAIATSTLANAMDDFGLAGQILPTIKAISHGMRFVGPAVTIQEVVGPAGSFTSADFKVGGIIDAASAGDVIVVAGQGARVSTWGGMASLAAKTKGVAGLLADIGVRDLEEIEEFGFPVFARHLTPLTGRTRLKVSAINVPVVVDGVTIAPGDLIVADGTGVVALPKDKAADIVGLAIRFAADDDAATVEIGKGLSFSDAMAKFTRI